MARNHEKPIEISDTESGDNVGNSSSSSSDDEQLSTPTAHKPPQKSGGGENPRSKASSSDPMKSGGEKRKAVEKDPDEKEPKKLKRRHWSETDEISILQGMIEYSKKKKSEGNFVDMKGFYELIKEGFDGEVTITQLHPKIRRMKEKYEITKKNEEEGEERVSLSSHEQRAYELSKQIWGHGSGKFFGSPKWERKSAVGEASTSKVRKERLEASETSERQKEWRRLKIWEMEIHLQTLDLMHARAKLILEAMKASEQRTSALDSRPLGQ